MTAAERSKFWVLASDALRAIGRHADNDVFLLVNLFTVSDVGRVTGLREDRLASILALAKPTYERVFNEWRAPCPLCLEGPQSPYPYPREAGFKYEEGLRRHLTGELGAHRCAVLEVAVWVAEAEAEERQKW